MQHLLPPLIQPVQKKLSFLFSENKVLVVRLCYLEEVLPNFLVCMLHCFRVYHHQQMTSKILWHFSNKK